MALFRIIIQEESGQLNPYPEEIESRLCSLKGILQMASTPFFESCFLFEALSGRPMSVR